MKTKKIQNLISEFKQTTICQNTIQTIRKSYPQALNLSDDAKRLLSFSNKEKGCFFEENCKLLSIAEIKTAHDDLHVDFAAAGIIPLIDTGDNNYISYDFMHNRWVHFNIVEEEAFKTKKTMEEMIKSIYTPTQQKNVQISQENVQTIADVISQYTPDGWSIITFDALLNDGKISFDTSSITENNTQYDNIEFDPDDCEILENILLKEMEKHSSHCCHFELSCDGQNSIEFL